MARSGGSSGRGAELTAEGEQFKRLFGKTSQIPPRMRNQFRKRLREAVEPVADLVRQEVQKEPGTRASRPRRTGLRRRIAAGVGVQIAANGKYFAGLAIVQRRRSLPEGERSLGVKWNSKRGWRHPVWPDKGATGGTWKGDWAPQEGRQYFGKIIIEQRRRMRQAALDVMADADAWLAKENNT